MTVISAAHTRVVVTSPSFSGHQVLTAEMEHSFPGCRFNISNRRLEGDELAEFIGDAEGAVIGLEQIDAAMLRRCSNLRIIAKYGVGLDNIDLNACEKAGVVIGWTGGVNRLSVAEMTLGFMLSLCRNLFYTSLNLKSGKWNKSGGSQLSGKTVGIIGAGNIGREVIRLLEPFHCRILVNDIIDISGYCAEHGLIEASKEDVFSTADIVSIHIPMSRQTRGLVNRGTLSLMKRSAFLINTARGGIVCQDDLAWALQVGVIAGAAVDVYEEEPPDNREFLALSNLICTPHIGGNSAEAVVAMGMSAIKHLKEFFQK